MNTIQVDTIRISGFRGLDNIEVALPRVTLLLGQNNSGKTSVIKALQLALGDYDRYLSDEDFHINENGDQKDCITVDVRFIPIESGMPTSLFSTDWANEFSDSIQQNEAGTQQYVAIRTTAEHDIIKGGYNIERFFLTTWEPIDQWPGVKITVKNKQKIGKRLESIAFISIEAQRDIHTELKEKKSFVGRVLSKIKYDPKAIAELEKDLSLINEAAISNCESLTHLKTSLDGLKESFGGVGKADLTPFPKKIRDLSKSFSVHFGETDKCSFPMEYHGLGTRSWASLLTARAFIELATKNHHKEVKPFFPIMALEEPESHLHPNAQRTLYSQLLKVSGQLIISTHSPYLAGLAQLGEIRSIRKAPKKVPPDEISSTTKMLNDVQIFKLRDSFKKDDLRKLQREVIHSRGEILFATAIVLSEGESEEQALPILFEHYMGRSPFSLGINFIGVGGSGSKYKPFLMLAHDLNIPVFIFSDGEKGIVNKLAQAYQEVFGSTDINNAPNITILDGTDFEGYLLASGHRNLVENIINDVKQCDTAVDKWILKKTGTHKKQTSTNEPRCPACRQPIKQTEQNEPSCLTCNQPIIKSETKAYIGEKGRMDAICEILRRNKTLYAKAISEKFLELDKDKIPDKIKDFFEQIKAGLPI